MLFYQWKASQFLRKYLVQNTIFWNKILQVRTWKFLPSSLLHLCVTHKALQSSLLSSFYFSLQHIWTEWWKLLVKFSKFKHTEETLLQKYLFQFEISCVETWHVMYFRVNNGESKEEYKWAQKCYQCFSWWKHNLMHDGQHSPKPSILLKVISFFRSENAAIFSVPSNRIIKKQNKLKQDGGKLKI